MAALALNASQSFKSIQKAVKVDKSSLPKKCLPTSLFSHLSSDWLEIKRIFILSILANNCVVTLA